MKITFLFGNGFDIQLGLETSYEDVKKAYCATPSKGKHIEKFKSSIKNNGKLWSDFELGMGEFTSEFNAENLSEYEDCIRDFTNFLNSKLKEQELKVCYSEQTLIKDTFHTFISNFYNELTLSYKRIFSNKITGIASHVSHHFISFNYTHVLDDCLKIAFKESNKVGSHRYSNTNYDHSVDMKIHHIHGELGGPLIMGMDNKTQIRNPILAESSRFCERYLKPATNQRRGTLVDEEALTLIRQSTIIGIFGMSLGDTDTSWWKHIAQWLLSNTEHRLLIYGYDKDTTRNDILPADIFAFEDNIRDRFLDVANVRYESRESIEKRIHVIRNTSLLKITLVQEDTTQSA